jgi:hypothetical protein
VVSAVSTHKFKIGESVFVNDVRAPATPFVVIKRMPERDGEFEYRVRCSYEPHERVVREGLLRAAKYETQVGDTANAGGRYQRHL